MLAGRCQSVRDVQDLRLVQTRENQKPNAVSTTLQASITGRGRRDSTLELFYLARAIAERPFVGGVPRLAPFPEKAAPPACDGELPWRRKAARSSVSRRPLLPFPFQTVALHHSGQITDMGQRSRMLHTSIFPKPLSPAQVALSFSLQFPPSLRLRRHFHVFAIAKMRNYQPGGKLTPRTEPPTPSSQT